jgi:hypothetical protein
MPIKFSNTNKDFYRNIKAKKLLFIEEYRLDYAFLKNVSLVT